LSGGAAHQDLLKPRKEVTDSVVRSATVRLVIGKTSSEPEKRLNRETRETPFGRAKGNSYGGRLFAGRVPTGF